MSWWRVGAHPLPLTLPPTLSTPTALGPAGPMSLATRCCSRQGRQDLQRDRQAGYQKCSVGGRADRVLARSKAMECLFAWRCCPEKLFSPTLAAKRCSGLQIEDLKDPESGYRQRCLATSWTVGIGPLSIIYQVQTQYVLPECVVVEG